MIPQNTFESGALLDCYFEARLSHPAFSQTSLRTDFHRNPLAPSRSHIQAVMARELRWIVMIVAGLLG